MSHFPPHLPPPSCSVRTHSRLSWLKFFVSAICAGFMAGLVGALIMINEWYPVGISNSGISLSNPAPAPSVLNSGVIRDWRPRVIDVYDESKLQQGKYYPDSARLSRAVLVNAGGWAVAPLSLLPQKVNFRGVDYQGHIFTIDRILVDESRNLMFIQFSGTDFYANTVFADRGVIRPSGLLWSLGENWESVVVGIKKYNTAPLARASVDLANFSLVGEGDAGRILITNDGRLAGFADEEGKIIPVWMVGYVLPRFLSGEPTPEFPFEWRGNFVAGEKMKNGFKDISGFLVGEIVRRASVLDHPVKKGDIIVKIQNRDVTRDNLAELALSAPDEFTVTVFRGDETLDLNVKK